MTFRTYEDGCREEEEPEAADCCSQGMINQVSGAALVMSAFFWFMHALAARAAA